jgi:molybdate transport system regulatory protein
MKDRREQLHPRLALWIEDQEGSLVFGKGRLIILDAIDRHGSLTAAAAALSMSYRGLWARVRRSEERLGYALIESHAGRGQGSGSVLTPRGRELLEGYRALLERVTQASDRAYTDIFGPPAS